MLNLSPQGHLAKSGNIFGSHNLRDVGGGLHVCSSGTKWVESRPVASLLQGDTQPPARTCPVQNFCSAKTVRHGPASLRWVQIPMTTIEAVCTLHPESWSFSKGESMAALKEELRLGNEEIQVPACLKSDREHTSMSPHSESWPLFTSSHKIVQLFLILIYCKISKEQAQTP